MPIDPTKLANLLTLAAHGKPAVAGYWEVQWDPHDSNETRYYGDKIYRQLNPYIGVGFPIEAKLLDNIYEGVQFEVNPDLKTETIAVNFDDIDQEIGSRFQTFKSGVRCILWFYYPDVDLHVDVWSGQLQAPQIYGRKQIRTVATNGFRSREVMLPGRNKRKDCTFTFGGRLPTLDAVASNGCPYDKHLGGSTGNFKTGSTPYTDCPKTVAACIARLGNNGLFHGGFSIDASAVVTDKNSGFVAISRGNASGLKLPVRVIFGKKYVRGMQLYLWRREVNSKEPDKGFAAGVSEVGEGPIQNAYNLKIKEIMVSPFHYSFRHGTRGQPRTGYSPDVSSYSKTSHFYWRAGHLNAIETTAAQLQGECVTEGFNEVCVYTDDSPITKTRQYSTNRVWCIMECYRNQTWGLGFDESKFWIADWMEEAAWADQTVSHSFEHADGETESFIGRRTALNVIMDGRSAADQIEDLCRAGGLSIPFWDSGKLTIRSFRKATTDELNNAYVFRDSGSTKNIHWDGQQHVIELSQIPDDVLTNEVEIRFEESGNYDIERPITIDDPDQKERAGRALGTDQPQTNVKRFSGFGLTELHENVRFGRRMLWFGEFDSGGIHNNFGVSLTCDFEHTLGLRRFEIFKVESEVLNGKTIGLGEAYTEDLQYFRVLKIIKLPNGRAQVLGQAYNHTAYTLFETDSVTTPSSEPVGVSEAGEPLVDDLYQYVGQVNSKPAYETGAKRIYNDGTKWLITVNGAEYYETLNNPAFPWLGIWTVGTNGLAPAPIVTQGIRINGGGCKVEIDAGSLNYDATRAVIEGEFLPC